MVASEHAVVVWIKLSDEGLGSPDERQQVFDLEDILMAAMNERSIGEYDGHEFGNGWCTIYMYGDSADRLHGAIAPTVARASLPKGSYLIKRYGGPGAREEHIAL